MLHPNQRAHTDPAPGRVIAGTPTRSSHPAALRRARVGPSPGSAYPGPVPVVTYSLLRLALLVVCLVGLVLAGTGWLLGVVGAALLAALLSYVLLRGPRDRAALWLQARSEARGDRPRLSRTATADAAEEDAAVEAAERESRTDGSRAEG
nr:DUF4229 domain-containing protein [Cellulomonas sp. IC4_254]